MVWDCAKVGLQEIQTSAASGLIYHWTSGPTYHSLLLSVLIRALALARVTLISDFRAVQQSLLLCVAAQSFLNYVLLCLVFTTWLACRRSDDGSIVTVLKRRGWKYLVLAFVDVEANYLIVKAYHYTTVTSVQVRDWFGSVFG